MKQKLAVVVGATGLVGQELLENLLQEEAFKQVTAVVRRPLKVSHEKLRTVIVPDFDQLENHTGDLNGTDFFCALGTTMKQAGSKEAFKQVDFHYPLLFAKIAKQQEDFQQFLLVSATGANKNAFVFYNKVKGQLESELEALDLNSLKIFQPSLLIGDRKEKRLGEQIGEAAIRFVSLFRIGTRKMLGGIRSKDVAKAMVKIALAGKPGLERFDSDQMVDVVDR